tara:strand:- start:256 stop:516 length:261 start_codon:yes stop_codon:yes gene_type:complete
MSSNNEIIIRIINDFEIIIDKILGNDKMKEMLDQIQRVDKVEVAEHYKPNLINETELNKINKENQETLKEKLDNNDITTLEELLTF